MVRIGFILVAILALPAVFQSTPTEILKLKTFDQFVITPEPSGVFVTLSITEEDLEREGGWPLPRQRLAEIQEQLVSNGAIGVGWAIAFPQPDRMGGDEVFAESLKLSPSVLAIYEDGSKNYPKTTGTVIKGPDIGGIMSEGVKSNLGLFQHSSYEGLAVAPTDVDQLVRQIPLLMRTPDGWVPSFGVQVYKGLLNHRTYIITTTEAGISSVSMRGIPPIETDLLGRKWISWVDTPDTDLSTMDVKDKFVIVGVTAAGVMPQLATPVGLLEPHKIQAALAESLLNQDSPKIPEHALPVEILILLLSCALIWLLASSLGMTLGLISVVGVFALTASGGFWMIRQGLLISVAWPLISQFITGSVAFYLRYREQYKLRQQIKQQFEHYLDPRQVKQLQDNPDLLKLGGEKRRCTFLFTDVRGFTALSESVEPEQVTYIMNRVLTAQQSAVADHDGMVDKYIGDAMMAIFNAPLDLSHHEWRAYQCALDIIARVDAVSDELEAEGLPRIAIGVGINTGWAIIGNMGSATRFDYTAIGDAVNTAARLESATKAREVALLVGHETEKYCGYTLKELEPIAVKGKAEPLKIFTSP